LKRVLISGGAGFLGTALVNLLSAAGGYEIIILDNLSPQIHGTGAEFPPELLARARCIRGDVTRAEDWAAALSGQEAVVHLAAETGTGQSMYEIARYCSVNVMGTALLLEACRTAGTTIRRIVLASSRAIYGEGRYTCPACGPFFPGSRQREAMERGDFALYCPTCGAPGEPEATDEGCPVMPVSVYGVTKAAQEQLLTTFANSWDGTAVALRFQNVYGPGQSLRNPYTGILSIFSGRLLAGHPIDLYEDGTESRDFIFVEDAARAILAALDAPAPPRVAYNAGTGIATGVKSIVSMLAEAYGVEARTEVTGHFRAGDIRHNFADTRKAEKDLGFRADIGLEVGIRAFCEWVKAREMPPSRYEESAQELRKRDLLLGGGAK
jgi:dTDP-L-rhamnose 4-epimerase